MREPWTLSFHGFRETEKTQGEMPITLTGLVTTP